MRAMAGFMKLFAATSVPGVLRIPGRWVWSENSIGPWGYVVLQEDAATLVDPPYFSQDWELATQIREIAPKGVSHILLTHDDFVGMSGHEQWHQEFDQQPLRVAHRADCHGLELQLDGPGPWKVGDFDVYHVPGHSAGSLFYALPKLSAIFTGDSLGDWSGPTGFPQHCRFGRSRQAASLRGFAKHAGSWQAVLPGHGKPMYFQKEAQWLEAINQAARGLEG
ncbi:Oxygen-insensitive NAD(P)H nitroreductase [Durusdinium trenchii]|uniref:Oxygen-insensitive NAD(P)H nitroreductase n=1 Tax=Durusdinium trenchii TaxID=1381693 RepID=A0ABP0SFU2_9DINO